MKKIIPGALVTMSLSFLVLHAGTVGAVALSSAKDVARVSSEWRTPARADVSDRGWEDGAYISSDGKSLYFAYYPGEDLLGDFARGKFVDDLDVYVSDRPFATKRKFSRHYLSEDVFSEGGIMIASNGDIYYHSNRYSDDGKFDTDIYRNNERLAFNDTTEEQNPHYCEVTNELFFDVADKEIWAFRDGGKRRLGPPFNVPGTSSFQPYLTPDCQTMYFTSNRGDVASRGPAIYRTTRARDGWNRPAPVVWAKVGVGEPSLTGDGRYLFFVQLFRARDGSHTSDIFFTQRR